MPKIQFKDFSDGFRTNNITIKSLSAGKNTDLRNTPYGRNIYKSNGNDMEYQITGEQIIGGFDYIKGDTHYHLIFTKTATESKAYVVISGTPTLIKGSMSKDATAFNAVNYNNGAFIVNDDSTTDDTFFYEYGASPEVTDINCVDTDSKTITGLPLKVFDNRIYRGNGSSLNNCGLGDATDWSSADVETTRAGYIKNFKNSSATIKAIEDYKSKLIIHRTNDTVALTGTSGSYEMEVVSNVGCCNAFSLANLDEYQLYFIKHINGTGLYYLSVNELGTLKAESELSKFIHEEFQNIDTSRLNEVYMRANTEKNQIWTHIPRTDYPNNAYWIIYDLSLKGFLPPRITQAITSAWLFNGDIYTGTVDGKILKEDSGDTFDGTLIEWFAYTQSMDYDTLEQKEYDELCQFELDMTRLNDFLLSFVRDDNDNTIISIPVKPIAGICMYWTDDPYSTDPKCQWGQNWVQQIPKILKQGKPNRFNTIKIRFGNVGGDIGLINLQLPNPTLA